MSSLDKIGTSEKKKEEKKIAKRVGRGGEEEGEEEKEAKRGGVEMTRWRRRREGEDCV